MSVRLECQSLHEDNEIFTLLIAETMEISYPERETTVIVDNFGDQREILGRQREPIIQLKFIGDNTDAVYDFLSRLPNDSNYSIRMRVEWDENSLETEALIQTCNYQEFGPIPEVQLHVTLIMRQISTRPWDRPEFHGPNLYFSPIKEDQIHNLRWQQCGF